RSTRDWSSDVCSSDLPVVIMLAVYLMAHVVLAKTKLGRYAYAIGGNEEATVLSGVNVKLYKAAIYALCGLLSSVAAIILTARLKIGRASCRERGWVAG